ncbi:MAG: hypothetical protein EU529_07470 [Promethearchaeota archaeon]|nr:MAG: hypothetical protein EU529_07470 [Candidatus Lokiarchaeota archaeon]
MAKKQKWLIMPKVHSKFNDQKIQDLLINKASQFLSSPEGEAPSFIFLSGQFFDVKGFAYSALRAWKGAAKPTDSGRRPLLEATFASLSVYLSSLLSLQSDFYFAYDEIKDILAEKKREDLWTIVEEKLPFISLPPREMYGSQVSPISPYFVINQDEDLILGEIYPSVYLTEIIKSIKSRFFVFFQHQGYSSFGFFNSLPELKKFGFEQQAREFSSDPTPENLLKYAKNAKNLKEVMVALIHAHNNAFLEQFLIDDYELLLNKLLEG